MAAASWAFNVRPGLGLFAGLVGLLVAGGTFVTRLLVGEDVAEYEGSFKVTRGLLKEFGPQRVIDTPIAANTRR